MGSHVVTVPDVGEGIAEVELVSWAVSVGESVQIVPFLAGTEGRLEDAPRFVARLLYRMLTGEDPADTDPMAPSLLRKGVPEAVDAVERLASWDRSDDLATLLAAFGDSP